MNPVGLFFVAAGAFSLSGALVDWELFTNHRKAQFMTSILIRTGARIFYGLIGSALIALGILTALGIIKDNS